jgi:hypothetical protein
MFRGQRSHFVEDLITAALLASGLAFGVLAFL